MKILLVSIPNHHFFQWANQLKGSGYEVYWFDITDGAGFVEKINWVQQFNGWKLKWNYPFRYRIKKQFPKLYSFLEKITVNNLEVVFENIIKEIQPDVVHCFEMKLSGLPILSIMQEHKIPFIYSSWGSDIYAYKSLGITANQFEIFLKRVDYLITDCMRDFEIARQYGFQNQFLGVFPGNGGIATEKTFVLPIDERKTICIKGYDDGVGKALDVIKAIELIELDSSIDFLIFSADENVESYLKKSDYFRQKKVDIISRKSFLHNKLLLRKLGSCMLYIGNSTSDGMPNSMLEAIGMGAFPIQSNPGKVTEEVIIEGVNGFLIEDTNNQKAIAGYIKEAVENKELRVKAQGYNVSFVQKNCNREILKKKIIDLYQKAKLN